MFEKSKNVAVTGGNFYYTEGNVHMTFHQNSYTGGAPADFYHDFDPTLRIPPLDEIEGSILFICALFLLGSPFHPRRLVNLLV